MMKSIPVLIRAVLIVLCSGCASIVSNNTCAVSVISSPQDAEVVITNGTGREIHKAKAPFTVVLPAQSGYARPAMYSIEFQKKGYRTASVNLSAHVNVWFFGNILFGGLVGFLIIDPLTGAMWELDDRVVGNLIEEQETAGPESQDGTPLPLH